MYIRHSNVNFKTCHRNLIWKTQVLAFLRENTSWPEACLWEPPMGYSSSEYSQYETRKLYITMKVFYLGQVKFHSDSTWFQVVLQTKGSDLVYCIQHILIILDMFEHNISHVLLKWKKRRYLGQTRGASSPEASCFISVTWQKSYSLLLGSSSASPRG